MAGWEEELAVLLRDLGVTQEEPSTRTRSTRKRHGEGKSHPPSYPPSPTEDPSADATFLDDEDEDEEYEEEAWLTDLNEMRREVDSIVTQVIQLMQRGDLDTSLKEDVLIVLRALRRRVPSVLAPQTIASASEEAYLESAASLLHFCRLVLRLSEVASEDR